MNVVLAICDLVGRCSIFSDGVLNQENTVSRRWSGSFCALVLVLKNSDSPHYLTDGLKKFQQNANIASAQYGYVSATGFVLTAVESRPNVRAVKCWDLERT